MKRYFAESGRKWIWLCIIIGFLLGVTLPFVLSPVPTKETWMMPLAGKVIVVDPGHGGPDGGASSKAGLVEKDVTLKIALYLRDYLQEAGAIVIMTREKDEDLSHPGTTKLRRRKIEDLIERVKLATEKQADIFISIHLNSSPSSRWSGAQTFYNPTRDENKKLAAFIQGEMLRNLGNTDRLARQKGDTYILKYSQVPTALVEVGFLSNPAEARLLGTDSYQKKLGASIYYGIMSYYSGERPPATE